VEQAVLAACSGAALALAFPRADEGWLAWVALVPLLSVLDEVSPLGAGLLGLVTGVVANAWTFSFVLDVPGLRPGYFAVGVAYLALYPALWAALVRVLQQRSFPLLVGAPALWVGIDLLRSHAGFLAVPWAALAHTQHHELPLLQLASFTGEAGIAALLVAVNVAVADALRRRTVKPLVLPAVLVALSCGWGALRLALAPSAPKLRVAVVQPSIDRSERATPELRAASLGRLEELSLRAAARGAHLIVWPEASLPDPALDTEAPARVRRLADSLAVPIVFGASGARKLDAAGERFEAEARSYNAAYLAVPGAPPGEAYRKIVLMPFGEYLPLESVMHWPPAARPWAGDTLPGDRGVAWVLPGGTRVAPIICWEGLFAGHVRRMLGDDARVLAHLTNASWCGRSGGSLQHELATVFRAAENRVPAAIASNTGPSMVVDPYGRVLAGVPGLFTQGVAVAEVPLPAGTTFYRRHGDLFAYCLAALAGVALGWCALARGSAPGVRPPPLPGSPRGGADPPTATAGS
jgi:apolipoprotein N-acyltransferase